MSQGCPQDLDSTYVASRAELDDALLRQKEQKARRPWLEVIHGDSSGNMYGLEGPLVIGRGAGCEVRIETPGVSRRHALVAHRHGSIFIEDLSSRNGTYVNGQRVTLRRLRDGDKIQVGPGALLRFSEHDLLDVALLRALYESATKDGLTKVANKQLYGEAIEREIGYARRHGTPLALVLFDVDHFKSINDGLGHAVGDRVLRDLAQLVERNVRTEDLVARVGGEEFAVVLRGLNIAQAAQCAERIRRLVESTPFLDGSTRIPVTISLGVASYEPSQSTQALYEAADAYLYEAKRGGRNCVFPAAPATSEGSG